MAHSDCGPDGPGTSARPAWRIRRSRRMAGEAASDAGPLRPRRRLLSPVASLAVLAPQLLAARLQPVVQRRQGGKGGRRLPKSMAGILDVLLDLPLLPTGGRI